MEKKPQISEEELKKYIDKKDPIIKYSTIVDGGRGYLVRIPKKISDQLKIKAK